MNIEIGEYVRTKDGRIGKLDEIYYAGKGTRYYGEDLDKNYYLIKYNADDEFGRYSDEEIVKHSKNIIDLIEVGDYVNGYRVRGKTNERVVLDYYYYSKELCDGFWISFWENQIVSIVTKEQFENMEYRL